MTSTIIEGLKIDVTSAELQEHIGKRATYHAERREFYASQIKALKAEGLKMEAVSGDPIAGLESSAKRHREASALFMFLAEHVIPDVTYRLEESDLSRLEILSRYF